MFWSVVLVAVSASRAAAFAPASLSLGSRVKLPAGLSTASHRQPLRNGRSASLGLSMVQTPPRQSVSIKDLSQQMQTARMDMEQGEVDERVRVLMEGMRGKSLNDDDFAADGTKTVSYTHLTLPTN